jgi:response regulator RpfG family c-di-GMP phosphodiesterase
MVEMTDKESYENQKKQIESLQQKLALTEQSEQKLQVIISRQKDQVLYDGLASDVASLVIMGLTKLSEYRDTDVGPHLERLREYSKTLALELVSIAKYKELITDHYIEHLYRGSILHDIGKVGIPDRILLKPGKVTPEEFEVIKKHSMLGGNSLKEIEAKVGGKTFLTIASEIAYYHHERWDGKGYPEGLDGENIPLEARIVALADVYDALTSKRVYKEALSHAEAVKIIVPERGKQFDPEIVDAFMARNKEFAVISEEMTDSLF